MRFIFCRADCQSDQSDYQSDLRQSDLRQSDLRQSDLRQSDLRCLSVIWERGTINGGSRAPCVARRDEIHYVEVLLALNHPPIGLTTRTTQTQLRVTTHGPEETVALGRRIGQAIHSNLFIALSGDLGAGKTTLTAGLAAGLGIPARVTSPTFTLVNEYAFRDRRLVHADVYRLEGSSAAELDGIGFGDLLDDLARADQRELLVLVMEWADRLGPLLPEERLDVTSISDEDDPDARFFTLAAWGETATTLLQQLLEA